jgi:hypothetical protein
MNLSDALLVAVGMAQAFAAIFVGGWMIAIYRRMRRIMEQQTKLIQDQVETSRLANRARMNVVQFKWTYFTEEPTPNSAINSYHLIVQWKNFGTTPAVKSWNWMNGVVLPGGGIMKLPRDFKFVPREEQTQEDDLFDFPAGNPVDGGRHPFTVEDLTKVYRGEANAFLWGKIEYTDVFNLNERHTTTFCIRMVVPHDPAIAAAEPSAQFHFESTGRFTSAN